MGVETIAKAIKENCKEDKNLQNLLIELLNFNFSESESNRYTDFYYNTLQKYANKGDSNEN